MAQPEALIAQDPIFAAWPDSLTHVRQLQMSAGDTIVHAGQSVRHVFYVVEGEVRLLRRSKTGSEIVLQRCRAGFFSEASLTVPRYHCDVVSAQSGSLLSFSADVFRQALNMHVAFRDAWMGRIARELRKVRAQCERLSLHGAAERVIHYIESEGVNGAITLNQSKKSWALELGLTHEALYRALRRMQDEGLLTVRDDKLVLKA